MIEIILIILFIINGLILFVLLKKQSGNELVYRIDAIERTIERFESIIQQFEKSVKDEFQRNRLDSSELSRINREELSKSLNEFSKLFQLNIKDLNELLRQKFGDFSKQQTEQLKFVREDNSKQLDEIRKTVDEKLQKTLNERLTQSFETVGKQLLAVQQGLGEMKNLASDVGGLKKVLSNVKMRGGIGEVQLAMLLEQILAPEQYASNVMTKSGSRDTVEFAIKLPGRNNDQSEVWLPVDAKFPKDVYEYLQDAYDDGDPEKISTAQRNLEQTIKRMARDIRDKYLDPPYTTDFGIMFLPFEGIYAEVVRKAALLNELQTVYKVVVTGPTTLAAILNSLQMGFKTLAIQQRSSEVWQVLGAVKKEFESFGGLMEKAQKNIQTGLNQLDDVMGKRTRAIQRRLKGVEMLNGTQQQKLLSDPDENFSDIEDENDK